MDKLLEQHFLDLTIKLDGISALINVVTAYFEHGVPRGATSDEAQRYFDASALSCIAADYITSARDLLRELEGAYDDECGSLQVDIDATILITSPAVKNQSTCSQKVGANEQAKRV